MPRKSISFTNQQDEWLKAQVASGMYRSEGEVISDLIRERQTKQDNLEAIRQALIVGEKSGISKRSPEDIINAAQEELRANGELPTQ